MLATVTDAVRSVLVARAVGHLRDATTAPQIQRDELPGILPTVGDLNPDSGHVPGEERDR